MANLKITLNEILMDGHEVTFKAPCDCSVIDKIDVRYISDKKELSRLFVMKDSHGNTLNGLGNLFHEGAYVHAILDVENGFAYIQNADTNGYLEERLGALLASDGTDFRFGVNEKGEYGYIITKDGADTVIPFSNAGKLYESLQYSGLVTEDMSFNEICNVLASSFPEFMHEENATWTIYSPKNDNIKNDKLERGEDGVLSFRLTNFGDAADRHIKTGNIDVKQFKYMEIQVSALFSKGSVAHKGIVSIISNGETLHSEVVDYDVVTTVKAKIPASNQLSISFNASYQDVTGTIAVKLTQ